MYRLVIHWIIHILLIFLIIKFLDLESMGIVFAVLGGVLIDTDHVPTLSKNGVRGYLYRRVVLDRYKPRKYKLHNFPVLFVSLTLSFFMLSSLTFYLGVFFLSMTVHLLFDLFEDVILYRTVSNWLV